MWRLTTRGQKKWEMNRPSRRFVARTSEDTVDLDRLLACPSCQGSLRSMPDLLECRRCRRSFPIVEGRPVFHEQGSEAKVMPADHISNQLSDEIRSEIEQSTGLTLNLGAGGTAEKLPRCLEFEYSVFRHTDVVGDAHHLPFKNNSFDMVVTFNTFEHLYDPSQAASEIFRVLRPGGQLRVQTAFLQPLHEPPHHYYNTTEFGLRRWFSAFEIEDVRVTPNFSPGYVLAWLSSAMIWSTRAELGPEAAEQLGKTTLDEWRAGWEDRSRLNGPGWDLLNALAPETQKQFAAGFQLEATKPQ